MSEVLTREGEQLRPAFDRDGYVCVSPLHDRATMTAIVAEMDRVLRDVVPTMPRERVYLEDKDDPTSVKQLQKLFEYSDLFHDLMFDGPARRIAEEVLRDEVVPMNMQYFNKPPGIGQPTPPHQDGYYFHLDPCEAVTGWLALEDVDDENGCIHYVRGSNRAEGFRAHGFSGVLGFSQGMTDFGSDADKANTVAFPGGPGTFLMHHARTIHWAGPNRSPTRSRRALGFIYYGKRARLDVAAKEAYQKRLDERLKAEGKI
ncbi:phytanoyl-CoA dioxygenase family protein [uncultured Alsobacter sp.]|uniref:phytanoyl-CoA dioxygenase family protein n=1 Tax=uncultured Alsobacter sp. TaxID=1748258 RepID=UPI00260085A1|nr:phytanoyl-CoA dioxygenase family protein [uncultured Alsobacter sp.]